MRKLSDGFAYGRVALGVSALVAPGPLGRAFGIGADNRTAARYIGGRDLVLGMGMLLGSRHGTARGWFEGAALVDVLDAATTLLAGATGAMPSRRAASVTVLALGSAATALLLARIDDSPLPADGPASPDGYSGAS